MIRTIPDYSGVGLPGDPDHSGVELFPMLNLEPACAFFCFEMSLNIFEMLGNFGGKAGEQRPRAAIRCSVMLN
jgi:hypothetical protein